MAVNAEVAACHNAILPECLKSVDGASGRGTADTASALGT